MRKAWLALLAFTIATHPVLAQNFTSSYPCTKYTDASGTYQNDAQLFAAAPPGAPARYGMFVQCLTASCQFALNITGTGSASLSAGPSFTVNGQFGFYNAASFGFIPQGAVRIVANASSTIVAFACPY